eukprot:gene18919-biopygen8431
MWGIPPPLGSSVILGGRGNLAALRARYGLGVFTHATGGTFGGGVSGGGGGYCGSGVMDCGGGSSRGVSGGSIGGGGK